MKQLDPKTRIPKNATLVAGSMAAIAGGVFPLASIASFLNICTLAYLVMLAFALLKLRKGTRGSLDLVNLKHPWFQSCQSYRLWSVCPL